jgi:hypothetical protein
MIDDEEEVIAISTQYSNHSEDAEHRAVYMDSTVPVITAYPRGAP